jgi:hypothetical protein
MEYYWEGRHPGKTAESKLLYGGKGWLRFTVSANGRINQGTGEFKDVCMDEARPPTTKMVDVERATAEETSGMIDGPESERRAQADKKFKAWPQGVGADRGRPRP